MPAVPKPKPRSLSQAIGACEWSLRSLRIRLRKALPSDKPAILAELRRVLSRVEVIRNRLPDVPTTRQPDARGKCKALGDRLLAEDRPPTPEELAEFESLKATLSV